MRLNLGCGAYPESDSINHDRFFHSLYVDVAWDLNILPWPWEDEQFSGIIAKAVLEHLDHNLVVSINECWRILEPGGTLYMKLPAWDNEVSYQDPTHKWFFSPRVFEYFDPDTPLGKKYFFYTPLKWKIQTPGNYNSGHSSIHGSLRKVVNNGS